MRGLSIMPHSGGHVGSGIYFAGMQEKSAQYSSGYGGKFACMFLCEAPHGKQHIVDSGPMQQACVRLLLVLIPSMSLDEHSQRNGRTWPLAATLSRLHKVISNHSQSTSTAAFTTTSFFSTRSPKSAFVMSSLLSFELRYMATWESPRIVIKYPIVI